MEAFKMLIEAFDTAFEWEKEFERIGLNKEQQKEVFNMLLNARHNNSVKCDELQYRINKAVEYIEDRVTDLSGRTYDVNKYELLRILKGE